MLRVALKKDPNTGPIVAGEPVFEAAWSDPEFLLSLLNAAHRIAAVGEPGKAIQILDAEIERDSVNPFNYYQRSPIRFAVGDEAGAFADLSVAIKVRPELGPKARSDERFRDMWGNTEFVTLTHQDG